MAVTLSLHLRRSHVMCSLDINMCRSMLYPLAKQLTLTPPGHKVLVLVPRKS